MTRCVLTLMPLLAALAMTPAWASDEPDATPPEDAPEPEAEDPWSDLGTFSRPAPKVPGITRGRRPIEMAVPETLDSTTPIAGDAQRGATHMPAPTVVLDAVSDRQEFEQTMGANFASFAPCYESQPVHGLSGHIALKWAVKDGRVISAEVVENSTGNSPVADCIIARIQGWRFPETFEREITYTLEFITD
ncbi:MAG: AgmX/PglI C-terminal domain-containing protein [Deltaproteobacteria bacterium]|nr:AgmX/PglI C-terminal domain-containing protein [Deltaproteobacteria bacterium]